MTHWADNYVTASDGGPLQDHVDAADGVPDEVSRQDQGAEDQQPGLLRREPPAALARTKPVCTMFTLCAHAIQFSMIMVYT